MRQDTERPSVDDLEQRLFWEQSRLALLDRRERTMTGRTPHWPTVKYCALSRQDCDDSVRQGDHDDDGDDVDNNWPAEAKAAWLVVKWFESMYLL